MRAATLLFLYAPLAIFLWGWLRPELAAVLSAALGGAAFHFRREIFVGGDDRDSRPSRRDLGLGVVLAFAWTSLSGAGGVGHQRSDWWKHNAILQDLIEKPWPPAYQLTEGREPVTRPLVFYLAYYLPAAVVGKAAGWTAANVALFLWTWVGASLALLWAARLGGGRAAMAVLVAAGGMDLLGYLTGKRQLPPVDFPLDLWAGAWVYQSASGLLFWVPHQALGGWLATALVLDGRSRGVSPRAASLEAFGAAFWSPFATFGLLPLWAWRVGRRWRDWREWLRAWPNWTLAPALAAILAAFYGSVHQPIMSTSLFDEILGPLAGRYLLFSAVEWGILWLLCTPWRLAPEWKAPAFLAGAILALTPFYRAGLYNDFAMRVPIPALFVLWLLIARCLAEAGSRLRRAALFAALAIAAVTAANEVAVSLRGFRVAVPDAAKIPEVHSTYTDRRVGAQYMGERESWFFRRLARPLRPPP